MPIDYSGVTSNLASVRLMFIKATSRYDLLVDGDATANTDNGANVFINLGQKWLDRQVDIPQLHRRYVDVLITDAYKMHIPNLIRIDRLVTKNQTTGEKTEITGGRLAPRVFHTDYASGLPSTWSEGAPTYWTPSVIGATPDRFGDTQAEMESDGLVDVDDMFFVPTDDAGTDFDLDGILLYPKVDGTYQIEVEGKFYSKTLIEDTGFSYWTVREPYLLALAGAMYLEMSNQNLQRVKTFRDSIWAILDDLDNISVEKDLSGHGLMMEG